MKFIFKRIGYYIVAFLGALTLNFFLPRMMPGNPVQQYIASLYQSGGNVSSEIIAAVEKMFGYDQSEPLITTFLRYIQGVFKGDWGYSFSRYPDTVLTVINDSIGWTIFLMGMTLILSTIINVLLGIYVAWKRGSKKDTVITLTGQIMTNIPTIIVAFGLSFAFAYTDIFPRGYAVTPLLDHANNWEYIKDVLYHAFLPILAMLLTSFGGIMGMRANMINQLGEDYIVMGVAKGVPDRKIMFGYGARNAMLPVVTSLAMQVGFLLGGSLLVERIFNYPGLGSVMMSAINGRDYPLLQGILLISTILMLSANFLADILSFIIDPRLRKQGK